MTDPLTPRLANGSVLLLDGGLATELEASGHQLDDALWSARLLLDEPEAIERVHHAYLSAGADIITTASYQASYPGLHARGLRDDEADAVFLRSVQLARGACDKHTRSMRGHGPPPLVAASLGAYGAYLADGSEYRGDYSVDDKTLRAFHRRRLEILGPAADLLAFETIPCLREVACIAELLAELPFPAWVSLCCRDDARLAHGEPIERCAQLLAEVPAVVAIGINCGAPQHAERLVARLRSTSNTPIIAYPNAGERYVEHGWCGSAATPEQWTQWAERWVLAGAQILGGCCRTTPRHLAAVVKWRRNRAVPRAAPQ